MAGSLNNITGDYYYSLLGLNQSHPELNATRKKLAFDYMVTNLNNFIIMVNRRLRFYSNSCELADTVNYNDKWPQDAKKIIEQDFYGAAKSCYRAAFRLRNSVINRSSTSKKSGIVTETVELLELIPQPIQDTFARRWQEVDVDLNVDYSDTVDYREELWDAYEFRLKDLLLKWNNVFEFINQTTIKPADIQDGLLTLSKWGVDDPRDAEFIMVIMHSAPDEDSDYDDSLSGPRTFTIPTHPSATYNYTVDWGDGNIISGYTGDATHTYAGTGLSVNALSVRITGLFPRIYFGKNIGPNTDANARKVLYIDQWGTNKWTSMVQAFKGCINLRIATTTIPDLSNVTDTSGMFENCKEFYTPLNFDMWDVSNVTSMDKMFFNCKFFDTPIGKWDIGNLTSAKDFLKGATSFGIEQYDDLLEKWGNQAVQSGVNIAFSTRYTGGCPAVSSGRNALISSGWNIDDGGSTGLTCGQLPDDIFFEMEIDVDRDPGLYPCTSSFYSGRCNAFVLQTNTRWNASNNPHTFIQDKLSKTRWHVDWGDGKIQRNIVGAIIKSYETGGVKTVRIWGNLPTLHNYFQPSNLGQRFNVRIKEVKQWGTSIKWRHPPVFTRPFTNVGGSFEITAADAPNFSCLIKWPVPYSSTDNNFPASYGVNQTFYAVQQFTGVGNNLNTWDTSRITSFRNAFYRANAFNQPLGEWDMSNARDIQWMFGIGSQLTSMSTDNWSETLRGWAGWNGSTTTKTVGLNPSGTIYMGVPYCNDVGTVASYNYILSRGWSISSPGGTSCP